MLSEKHVGTLLGRMKQITKSRDNHIPSFFAARIRYLKLAGKALPGIEQEIAEIACALSCDSNLAGVQNDKRKRCS